MKVAMLHWAFPPVIGGVESHLAMLGPELVSRGHPVSLLTGSLNGLREEYQYGGMLVRRSPLMDLNSLDPDGIKKLAGDIRRETEEFLKAARPDLVHAHNMHYFSPIHAEALFEAAGAAGVPVLLTAHNVWDDGMWREMLRFAGRWDHVIAVSGYIKNELAASGYPAGRITVVHHGIDLERFRRPTPVELEQVLSIYPQFKGRRVIFHPARLSLDKGCHISVRALDLIRRHFPDVLLVLAGTEKTVDWNRHQQEHVRFINGLIHELGLQEHVLVRFFRWEDMPAVYQGVEFCLYPSCFQEPFGLVMLESMACGRPIVVSRAGGMPEVVADGVNGYLVEMGDHRALADRCIRLLSDRKLTRRMGEAGRQMVKQRFTKEIMVKNTLNVYNRVLMSGSLEIA
ncbi:MAG: glycosyltransferase family 4 protein [Peptococcaceae bacterium]|nr:glycosyltransferase family 4 protein [Peptococcaceae bacterium]